MFEWHAWLDTILEALILLYIVKEYYYDAAKDKNKPARRTRRKKVVVRVEDGQAHIIEQPKDVEVTIENP